MSVTTRFSNQEYGSVFKSSGHAGPVSTGLDRSKKLPMWSDMRYPGTTDPNMEARKIMANWTPDMVRRFQLFIDDFMPEKSPWAREWFNKTAPEVEAQKTKIIKCKMELIKRLLRIKVTGPLSMEDWCLLFLYHDHRMEIPQDIETLIRPAAADQSEFDFLRGKRSLVEVPQHWVSAARRNKDYPANLYMPGFERTTLVRGVAHEADTRNTRPVYRVEKQHDNDMMWQNYPFFPRLGTNTEERDRTFRDRLTKSDKRLGAGRWSDLGIVNYSRGRDHRNILNQN